MASKKIKVFIGMVGLGIILIVAGFLQTHLKVERQVAVLEPQTKTGVSSILIKELLREGRLSLRQNRLKRADRLGQLASVFGDDPEIELLKENILKLKNEYSKKVEMRGEEAKKLNDDFFAGRMRELKQVLNGETK